MIAADTSVWIDFSKGSESERSKHFEAALSDGALVMPVPVLFEVLSGPGLTKEAEKSILELPRLEPLEHYWERAGVLRRSLLRKGFKARAIDCLIAQNCIDYKVALITTDKDFRHFSGFGLKLA